MPSAEDLLKEMFLYLLDPADEDRAFVKFSPHDKTVMLINNFGGLSNLELEALTGVARAVLGTCPDHKRSRARCNANTCAEEREWKLYPVRIYSGTFETSLNGPGFSVTLGNISGMAEAMELPVSGILELLDAPTMAPAWPKNSYAPIEESHDSATLRDKAARAAGTSRGRDNGPNGEQILLSPGGSTPSGKI
jgi:triose/dihydroxyacetone kinase / FAD-AMP lyase (cyclizing)